MFRMDPAASYEEWENERHTRDNPPMPQTSKEKQEAFRARNAMLGKTEVRGIFLPPEQHAALKKLAREFPHPKPAQREKRPKRKLDAE